jgi:hypothetical protein
MYKYKATTKNNVMSTNTTILADGFSSLLMKNIGTDTVYINDNIEIKAGSSFGFDNLPYVAIGENTTVMFANSNVDKRLLVVKTYFKLL